MTISDQLNMIFRKVFEDPAIQITQEMTADDVDGWDSLSHVNLILAVEHHFKIKFSQKEILRFRNVGDLMSCIKAKCPDAV